jgi:stage V sporulation protein G
MEITNVRLSLRNEDRLKAYVTVTFDDAFVVRGMKVIRGNSGMFVAMPSRKMPDGTFRDIAHPINNEMREHIEKVVITQYEEELDSALESVKKGPEEGEEDEEILIDEEINLDDLE